MVIDFLEPYLFPLGEKRIEEWIATGFSLGGASHSSPPRYDN